MEIKQLINAMHAPSLFKASPPSIFIHPKSPPAEFVSKNGFLQHFVRFPGRINAIPTSRSSSSGGISMKYDNGDGVSLGTMKLPGNTDIARFETLLFQWGNSLCQGANLPLPAPLKCNLGKLLFVHMSEQIDKIPGGARIGFTSIEDGKAEVLVYIDCLVFDADTDSPVPIFRAIRNGPKKDEPPPGEPRIMRSLLSALQKCVEIARK